MVVTAGILTGVAGSRDATPDAVNWANIGPGNTPQSNANQTLQNFDGSITLKATFTGSGPIYYRINSGSYTLIVSGGTFAVSDGDTVNWQAQNFDIAPDTNSGTVTVTNESDGGVTLDTFTYSVDAV